MPKGARASSCPGRDDIEVDAVRRLGGRALLTRGSMSLGEKDEGLHLEAVMARHQQFAQQLVTG
ncbi:hypothetical protein EU513_00705 [Yimella sp. RIT 621]|uniref:hypothetical protein n=1 Tax=Yimella sp. RIT 621 TaxID=2510323 RepID=UPI00101DA332|nr:hypothetical protein [Yimella sp. RIT 621]RYG78862.1 hypothetical protein EU513_00705 [Yimella sp. RIT 621]